MKLAIAPRLIPTVTPSEDVHVASVGKTQTVARRVILVRMVTHAVRVAPVLMVQLVIR